MYFGQGPGRFFGRLEATSATLLQQLPQDTLGSSALSVKVHVLPANPPDAALRADIDDLEFLRSDRERDMLESVFVANGGEVQ